MRKKYEKPMVEYISLISQEAVMTNGSDPAANMLEGSMGLEENPFD